MTPFVRAVALVLASASAAAAATPEQIDTAISRGTAVLKTQYRDGTGGPGVTHHGIGPAALAGIALLEANTPANDPTVQAIAGVVRDRAYNEYKTYQLSLDLLFLDRLENPADAPVIQMLAVRLLAGQNARGGWTYNCVENVPQADEQRLRAGLKNAELATKDAAKGGPRLHPVVQEYAAALANVRNPNRVTDDNSNTQFAVLAVWAARRYGVPTDPALDLIERRFLTTQDPQGGWAYMADPGTMPLPSMTCAGLLGVATAIGRREEKRQQAEAPKPPEPAAKSNDPFFNPPARPDGKAAGPKRPTDARDAAAGRGFGFLGAALTGRVRGGPGETNNTHNLYFLWSLERVGVIYGVDKIGGVDWYASGADYLVRGQDQDGTWNGAYGPYIDTSFAVLFLCKANLARDLSRRVRGDPAGSELRAGATAPVEAGPLPKRPVAPVNPLPAPVVAPLPAGAAGKVTADLLAAANGPGWTKALAAARDAKGADYTAGLVAAVHRLDGDKKRAARDALAERLSRMSAETLRGMMTGPDAELRRGAVLAAAMRDDQGHVPDLIERVTDADELVVRAARAGLRSLTGRDFGPQPGAAAADRAQAAAAWRAWWAQQKR